MASVPKPRPDEQEKSYLVNRRGKRIAVVLPIKEYEALLERLEDLSDLLVGDAARNEPGESIPWEEVKAELHAKRKRR